MRQWIRVAHDLGAKYAILVAKYISGSCLWPAKGYDYSVANSGNKTDVVRAFVDACNEYGLKAGFYYCILDPHNEGTFEKFDWDSLIPDHVFEIVKRQVAELHQRQQPGIQAEPRKSGEYVRASQLAVRRHQWRRYATTAGRTRPARYLRKGRYYMTFETWLPTGRYPPMPWMEERVYQYLTALVLNATKVRVRYAYNKTPAKTPAKWYFEHFFPSWNL